MAYSIQTAVSDGTLAVLDLSIKYMDKSHIQVYVDDVLVDGSAYSYVWLTDTRIQIVPAVVSGSTLKVIRKTLTDEMWHEFTQGARFSTTSMDENFEQLLFLAQEYSEGIYVSDFYTDLDMHLHRLINVADPTSDNDAVNLRTLKDFLPYGEAAQGLVTRVEALEPIPTYAALRAYTGNAVRVQLGGRTNYFDKCGGVVVRTGNKPDDDGTVWVDALGRSWERVFEGGVNIRWFGAKGGDVDHDDAPAIQKTINVATRQYDPTQTTHNGNDVTYMGRQKPVLIPVGRFNVKSTLNFSFRNQVVFEGEDEWNSTLWWTGPVDGMIIDARCSNYVDWKNFTLDGNHKALTFIYQAGNGNNAVGSKGNVTGNRFSNIYFWNQKGNLVTPFVDYSDQYNPLTAMLCTTSIDTPLTYYNSMDDSVIENCRFAPNSLNNFYCMAISSSGISISDTQLFAGNGILASNGAQFWMRGCVASLYAPAVQDSQHNHALIKFDYNGGIGSVFRDIELHDCYLEGMDYYGGGHSVKLAYWAQGSGAIAEQDKGVLNLLVNGGLYSGTAQNQNYTYIDIQANRRANIRLINANLQGPAKLYVYAPDSAVEVNDASLAISGNSLDTQTWQIAAAKSISRKYQTPELQVQGSVAPTVSAVVGTSDYPGQIRFLSLDEALEYLSDCKSPVVIYLDQDDTVTRGGTLNGDVTIALQGFTLNINATLTNRGNLTVRNSFANNTRGGTLASTGNYLRNVGSIYVQDCYLNKAINNASGMCLAINVEFTGSSDSILNTGAGRVVVDLNTCTFSGSGFVVNLGGKFGDVMVKSTYGAIPSTGKWMRGTRLEHDPATAYPNQYWATVDGIGAAANWAKVGNLTV